MSKTIREITPHDLWSMTPAAYNAWRQSNDLPVLLAFFISWLPDFSNWMREFGITNETFIRAPRTGEWFLGKETKEYVEYTDNGEHMNIISEDFDAKFAFLGQHRKIAKVSTLPFLPYLVWGRKQQGRNNS